MTKLSVDQALLQAQLHAKKGEVEEAKKLYQAILQVFPENKSAQQGLADVNGPRQSINQLSPPQEVINQLINLYKQQQLEAVIERATLLTEQYPEAFMVWNILGAANKGLNRVDDASKAFRTVTELNPNYADGFNNLGIILQGQGKLGKAIKAYKKALVIKPGYAEAYYNIGNAFQDQGKLDEAIESYKKALALKPDYAEAYNNLGNSLQDQARLGDAIASYKKAVALKPDYAEAYNNMGNAFLGQKKFNEAVEVYTKALAIRPDYTEAFYHKGNALKNQGNIDEAIVSFEKALALKPDYAAALAQKLHQQASICDWDSVAADINLISELGTSENYVSPFDLLSLEDAPDRHRIRSEIYANVFYPKKPMPATVRRSKKPERIHIGYFSADFHNFPGMYLMAGMLENHDRSRFQISAYSYGQDSQDDMRHRILGAVDNFIDIKTFSVEFVRQLVIAQGVDIAVHRNGYTKNNRTELFASRLAPLQINYLGYPGTLGADFMDYIVADPIVIPCNHKSFFSEEIIYLPHTYQPTDDKRVISCKITEKADMGLPKDAFVFCCFNASYKISPSEFDIWMRLLNKVEGSVLWLLKSNRWAEQNLKREAEKRGVNSGRLIFAERMPQAEHLARHKHADLFIDTFNCNAHTTASDALWAGLPLVTKLGKGFAARVAGSVLNAVGLPELITENEQEYESLILELALNPGKLASIKEKLAANRLAQPLFDTERYTKNLEDGYKQAYQNYLEGKPPRTIIV